MEGHIIIFPLLGCAAQKEELAAQKASDKVLIIRAKLLQSFMLDSERHSAALMCR